MSLLLAYHNATQMVVASDRRAIDKGPSGKNEDFAGDSVPKFAILPNGLVLGALGRQDVGEKLKAGTLNAVRDNPRLTFEEMASFLPEIARTAWKRRPLPNSFDHLTVQLFGWSANLGRMRVVDWDGGKRDFAPVENWDPKQNLVAFGCLVPATVQACNLVAHRLKKAEFEFGNVANHLRAIIRDVSRVEQKAVSYNGYFAAFDRDKLVSLPDDFILPPVPAKTTASQQPARAMTVKGDAVSGEHRFFVGSIMTPGAGAGDTVGSGDGGAGAQIGNRNHMGYTQASGAVTVGGTVSNPENAIDGDSTTFASVIAPHGTGSAGPTAVLTLSFPTSLIRNYQSLILNVKRSVTQNFSPHFGQTTYFLRASVGPEGGGGAHVEFDQLMDSSGNLAFGTASLDLHAAFGSLTNVSQIYLIVHTESAVSSTAGQIEADIYDATIVGTE